MKKWFFFIKAFNMLFKMNTVKQEKEEIEMYVCAICNSIYLDKNSYLTHYKVDSCVAHMYILPGDPLKVKDII